MSDCRHKTYMWGEIITALNAAKNGTATPEQQTLLSSLIGVWEVDKCDEEGCDNG